MSESSLITLQVLRTVTLLKRDPNTDFFLRILWIIQQHLFCEDTSEMKVRIFKNSFFAEHFQWLLLTVSGFQPTALSKKCLSAKMFICDFCKFFNNIFWQNSLWWLLLICEFWEVFQITFFIEHLWEIDYFIYKLLNFNHHIHCKVFHKCFSSILYKKKKKKKYLVKGIHVLKISENYLWKR